MQEQKAFPLQDQVKFLEQKYSGNWNPFSQKQGQQVSIQKDHPVPIENYLNAQCKFPRPAQPTRSF